MKIEEQLLTCLIKGSTWLKVKNWKGEDVKTTQAARVRYTTETKVYFEYGNYVNEKFAVNPTMQNNLPIDIFLFRYTPTSKQ